MILWLWACGSIIPSFASLRSPSAITAQFEFRFIASECPPCTPAMMAITVIAVMANVSAIKAFNFLTDRNISQLGWLEEAITNRDILHFPLCHEISYRNFDR